jgi:hypothetical protein
MSLGFLYWLILILAFIFSGYWSFRPTGDRGGFGVSVAIFVLFVILGLKLFGFPISG